MVDLETLIAYFGHGLNDVISTNGPGLAGFHLQPRALYQHGYKMQIVAKIIDSGFYWQFISPEDTQK